jgi:hypothetical protein
MQIALSNTKLRMNPYVMAFDTLNSIVTSKHGPTPLLTSPPCQPSGSFATFAAIRRVVEPRRFPPPWSVEEQAACFVVCDHNGQ